VKEASVREVAGFADRLCAEVERAVTGKRESIRLLIMALLADGHVLIEDLPGLAKTLMARSLATVSGLQFKRIQFTPDLMPSDVTGYFLYQGRETDLVLRRGPIFAHVVLADEVNRAPAKTQSALLEAMQERQVTIEGHTELLVAPFMVIATQNPIEFEGTYPLPEAQLDRFLIRTAVGYPDARSEAEMVRRRAERRREDVELAALASAELILAMQQAVETVHVDPAVVEYMITIVAQTRGDSRVVVGASPRGSLALLKMARAGAAMQGRDFVTPQDVKDVAIPALAHRISLRPELWVQRIRSEDVVRDCLARVVVPAAESAMRTT
jgi:MoxR-like ATPase